MIGIGIGIVRVGFFRHGQFVSCRCRLQAVECLAVYLFAKGREWADRSEAGVVAVEQQSAASAFQLLKLVGERALAGPEHPCRLGKAGMIGADDEAGEALTNVSTDEHGSKWLGDLRGVDTGDVEMVEPFGAGAAPHRDRRARGRIS